MWMVPIGISGFLTPLKSLLGQEWERRMLEAGQLMCPGSILLTRDENRHPASPALDSTTLRHILSEGPQQRWAPGGHRCNQLIKTQVSAHPLSLLTSASWNYILQTFFGPTFPLLSWDSEYIKELLFYGSLRLCQFSSNITCCSGWRLPVELSSSSLTPSSIISMLLFSPFSEPFTLVITFF